MVLQVPCTRLSQKIITHDFGPDPIALTRTHPLWLFLRPHAEGDRVGKGHMISGRDSHFLITVHKQLAHLLHCRYNDAGVALHRHHLNLMLRFTWAANLTGTHARTALRIFMEIYNITDDDYDLDSAYRAWQRWQKENIQKKPEKLCAKRSTDVLFLRKPSDGILPDERDVEGLARFITARMRFRYPNLAEYILQQINIWLHVHYGRYKKKYVAKKFGIALRTVQHATQKISGYIAVDEDFANLVLPENLFTSSTENSTRSQDQQNGSFQKLQTQNHQACLF